MANMTVEIETTRSISAQIIRHRSFSFQEFSQRYADTGELGSAVIPHLRRQDHKNRQNSIDDLSSEDVANYYRRISLLFEDAEHLYREMVSQGIAKECARNILPLGTQTRLYMNGTIRSYIHYLQVRTDPSTQLEHREIALAIKDIFCKQFPIIGEAVFSDQ
jgi:thymidylate synthase (FAD)